jgi:polyisoprenoid-binding protein YceI
MKRRAIWIAIAVAAVLLAVAGILLFEVFSGDAPPEAALSSSTFGPSATRAPDTFDGTWSLDTTSGSLADGSATFAGYRVEEQLSTLGTHEAVGRTHHVTGSMTISGRDVTSLDISVDMTTLRSDDDRRDGQLRERGLETERFPTATFSLTQPIRIGNAPAVGEQIDATATGDLTLHGTTNRVTVPVTAQWTGERLEVAGSLDIAIADYGIEKPTGFIVLSIADTGTIEFHLLFGRG